MSNPFSAIKNLLKDRFNLDEDKADEELIVESIKKEVHFKGTNLWTLIFAIFIASIGLNVNSTAVIIGAMLISPIMGPIMGIGLAIGTNDFDLLQKGIKNFTIAPSSALLHLLFIFSSRRCTMPIPNCWHEPHLRFGMFLLLFWWTGRHCGWYKKRKR
jgi:hypothetical protein